MWLSVIGFDVLLVCSPKPEIGVNLTPISLRLGELCRWGQEGDDGVAAGRRAAAPEALEGPRPAAHARAAYRDAHPQSVKQLAGALPAAAWRTVTWREGTRGAMRSRFARLRVRPAHRDEQRAEPRPQEWLLIKWPRDDAEPTKCWLSTLPASTSLAMSEVGASGPHPSSTRAKRGSAARHSASGSPSSRRTMLAPRTIETIL